MNKKEALALAKKLQADTALLVDFLDGEVNPPVPPDPRVEIIDKHLNGHGAVIIEAAKRIGLALPDACALVEQETGGRNIFEEVVPPEPWDGALVTNALVQRMIDRPGYATASIPLWGMGLVQLTWPDFVIDAHELPGGGEKPLNQLFVGYKLLNGYLRKYPRERGFASYNAGDTSNWVNGRAYASQIMAKARVWGERLGEEPKPDPQKPWIKVEAKPEWSKGGGPYVASYPTHYDLRPDVKKLAEKYVNLPRFYRKVSANTYVKHPPAAPAYEHVSVDFWDWGGRGVSLDDVLQRELTDTIFDDPSPPLVQWMISNGKMWVRDGQGWRDSPTGPAGSDPGHFNHIHVSYRLEGG